MNPVPRDEAWNVLRSVEPPPGAKARGLARLAGELEPARRRRRAFVPALVVTLVLVAGTTLAAVGVQAWRASQEGEVRTEHAPKAPSRPGPVAAAPAAPEAPARSNGESGAPGEPAENVPAKEHASRAVAAGHAKVPSVPATTSAEIAGSRRPPDDSLTEQVAEYRKIAAMADRETALREWRGMLARWPRTTLRHEIELNIVDALARLGRREEARSAAGTFLKHFPSSPRAADMKKLSAGDASK